MSRMVRSSLLSLSSFGLRVVVLATVLGVGAGRGQTEGGSSSAAATVVDVLHEFSGKASVIFAGQVLAVRRPGTGVGEVEFRVDRAVRGCSAGAPYVLREWDGLWAGGVQRYKVGQRLLMLLHAASAAGMSSPVGGMDGAIPIRQGSTAADGAGAAEPPYVDLRWLGTRVPRAVVYAAQSGRGIGAGARAEVAAAGSVAVAPMVVAGTAQEASVPSEQVSVDAVVEMLMGWQRAQHGAP
jgi:hypothetical protein